MNKQLLKLQFSNAFCRVRIFVVFFLQLYVVSRIFALPSCCAFSLSFFSLSSSHSLFLCHFGLFQTHFSPPLPLSILSNCKNFTSYLFCVCWASLAWKIESTFDLFFFLLFVICIFNFMFFFFLFSLLIPVSVRSIANFNVCWLLSLSSIGQYYYSWSITHKE